MRNIVNALLIDGTAILLAKRSPYRKAYANLWSFPGGHLEAGETLEHALVREAREEIGIVPIDYAIAGRIADPNAPAGDPVMYHMYTVTRWDGGKPRIIDDEHAELEWFPTAIAVRLPGLALEEYRPLLEELMGRLRSGS